ncbi:unnamed protein product [Clonostachys solani]|uniref:Uncharacterized protein n=1 Tax=Clonostachys solani TaxID=160281 RepID=A0A9P0ERU6_9HYPO|nr:unnamed protein product [Clonostachys solani]
MAQGTVVQLPMAWDTRVQPNSGLRGEYIWFIPNSVTSQNVTVPITAGHSAPSQDPLLPDTNHENFLDPAHDSFVGALEPMVPGPQFGLTERLEAPSTSFLDFPGVMAPMEGGGVGQVPETPSPGTSSTPSFDEEVSLWCPALMEGAVGEQVPETPSPGTSSTSTREKKCSSCRKWAPERDFLARGGRLAATCNRCRANKRQYHKGKPNPGGTPPTTQRCTACHEEAPIGDFDATATCSRKCSRCRGEGRPVAPTLERSSRPPSKCSRMPTVPGKTRCSGCGKAQDDRLFFNYEYDPPRKRNTCVPCRQRKREADLRKRESREAVE